MGDDDRADEVEDESVENHAYRKGLVSKNPLRRRTDMANGDTKADLQDAIDQDPDFEWRIHAGVEPGRPGRGRG